MVASPKCLLGYSPTMAAISKIQKFSKYAKTRPLTIIRAEPAKRIFRRPTRSAIIVRKIPRKTSPSSVSVMNRPIRKSENFSSAKNKAMLESAHAQYHSKLHKYLASPVSCQKTPSSWSSQ